MNKFGGLKIFLFFLAGAIGPVIPKLTPGTQWSELSIPLYVLGMVYSGVMCLLAYLIQSPIPKEELFTAFKKPEQFAEDVKKIIQGQKKD